MYCIVVIVIVYRQGRTDSHVCMRLDSSAPAVFLVTSLSTLDTMQKIGVWEWVVI